MMIGQSHTPNDEIQTGYSIHASKLMDKLAEEHCIALKKLCPYLVNTVNDGSNYSSWQPPNGYAHIQS
jgi:hypothetical protein